MSLLWIPPAADAEPVRVGSTGPGSVLMQRLVQVYQQTDPSTKVIVIMPPLSSGGGIRAVSAGKIDLAVVGRPLRAEEAAMPGLGRAFEYVRTSHVVASSTTQSTVLSQKQLVDIYAGRLMQWPDGSAIRLVLRSRLGSDTAVMRAMSPDMSAAIDSSYERQGMVIADNDIDTVNLLVKTPGSLGATTLGLLRLDGVDTGVGMMAAGGYPWVNSIQMVTAATPTADAWRFLAFPRSDTARRLLDDADLAGLDVDIRRQRQIDRILPRSAGGMAFLVTLDLLGAIDQAARSGDRPTMLRVARTRKSASASVGAMAISEKARERVALPAEWPQLLHSEHARLQSVLAHYGATQDRQIA